jgi:carbohydrate kinase (thermoresistant glucokinase family)
VSHAVVVMGVAGSGKTTVGAALADRLGVRFVDADDHHPPANVDKMRRGVPLDDADRAPWLERLHDVLQAAVAQGPGVVLACSALTRAARRGLAAGTPVRFVYLQVDEDRLAARLRARTHHFMSPDLLASQLATLEEPGENEALTVDGDRPVDAVVDEIAAHLSRRARPG